MDLSLSRQSVVLLVACDISMRSDAARLLIFGGANRSIVVVPRGAKREAGRPSVKYRSSLGEFVDTTLDRVAVDEVARSAGPRVPFL
jgi:hypothetical protein